MPPIIKLRINWTSLFSVITNPPRIEDSSTAKSTSNKNIAIKTKHSASTEGTNAMLFKILFTIDNTMLREFLRLESFPKQPLQAYNQLLQIV